MLVFIDESGDAGFKIDKGSSTHFVVTLVLFTDKEEALKADEYILEIRKQLNLRFDFEFHCHKSGKKTSTHFFTEINQFDFQYFSVVIDKREIDSIEFHSSQNFYNFACQLVCQKAKYYLSEAIIVIDGKNSREFKTMLGNYLKKNLNDPESKTYFIKKVKMQDLATNNLLQLADMICGAVARSYKNKKNAKIFRRLISEKEIIVEEFQDKE